MRHPLHALALTLLSTLFATAAFAQPGTHQHYGHDAKADQAAPDGTMAPRLQNLGDHKFPVTTKSSKAQLFVNQGMNLAFGFNHAEAGRSFREAARLDPNCAMAYWGQAWVLGPNINAPMDSASERPAKELAAQAVRLRASASPRERAYIDALAKRYTGDPAQRVANDSAFATAMAAVARQYPTDHDAQIVWAESAMNLRPWNYWRRDGTPYPGTVAIRERLEQVLAKAPNHPQAIHLYIHLMEPTNEAHLAELPSDRLQTLVPGAGHMVHMPSHIYQRVGRYADAIKSNQLAAAADEDYITQCRAQGLYPMAYYPHNIHFIWFAASADGQAELAISSARKVASKVPDSLLAGLPLLGGFRVVPYYALTRFGKWDEMLAEPKPSSPDKFVNGIWHYARGLALAAKGRRDEAMRELEALRTIAKSKDMDYPMFSPNLASKIIAVGPEVLAGEIAMARGDHAVAIDHFNRAVRLEDQLVYTEPEEWHYPPRLSLGAALLAAGRAGEAEVVYWEDLRKHPENGWALKGLADALTAQGRTDEAADANARFAKAWARSDVKLPSSRFAAAMK